MRETEMIMVKLMNHVDDTTREDVLSGQTVILNTDVPIALNFDIVSYSVGNRWQIRKGENWIEGIVMVSTAMAMAINVLLTTIMIHNPNNFCRCC